MLADSCLRGQLDCNRVHCVHIANTAAIQQYEGLKYTDDTSDARWLAQFSGATIIATGGE
jgi:hypothetical protein